MLESSRRQRIRAAGASPRLFQLVVLVLCCCYTGAAAEKELPIDGEVFTVAGRTAFLILPAEPNIDTPIPWVWYAPTLPGLPGKHEEWMFKQFLDNGIAIAGVDIGESYGSPKGRAIYSALHDELVENRGLTERACLLARSRGGLMLYCWAAEHPASVACIAGIYPVCNIASYPGLGRACSAYDMTEGQLAAKISEHNPIDRLAPLAKAKIPIFHIHGDRDTVVPLDRNSGEVEKQYSKLGGKMKLEVVKGQGHNLWSGWFQNQDLVDFVIAHANLYPPEKRRELSPGHTTYFIDPADGCDANSGVERKSPWRTFRRFNQLLLSAGDRVEVIAPGSFDQTLMLMGAGTEADPVEVSFAPGRYDLHPDNAYREKYQISNANDDPEGAKAVGILLAGARHVRISGPDACLVYRGKMIEVCIDRCQDITICDLQFDYHRPTVSEFTVATVGDGYVDLKINKDSHYRIEDGQITWEGEGWSYKTGLAQELDLSTNEVWRRRDPLKSLVLEELKPFVVRARGQHDMRRERVYQIRDTRRDCAGVFTRRSKNVTWQNVKFQFLHGMGLVNQFSENLTFDSVAVAPGETSGRTTAAWADCIQVSGCRGRLLVEDCLFSGAHDDAINIHGTHLRVVERSSDRQIKVRFMHAQTFGFKAFNPGDEIEFVKWDSLRTYGPNRIEEARLINPKELLLTLESPVPDEFQQNDVLENVTWTPEVEIRDCLVSRIPTRGFLITTRRRVLVEDNQLLNTHMSAILLEDDARGWYESGCVRDMTIRGNRFIHCGEPVIHINPRNTVANDSVHRNIRIEDNEFVLRDATIVQARSTNELQVSGNTVYSERKANDDVTVLTSDCSDVLIERNVHRSLSPP